MANQIVILLFNFLINQFSSIDLSFPFLNSLIQKKKYFAV